jgi:RNA polymerase sigma-70 factor (ECF subfamily)
MSWIEATALVRRAQTGDRAAFGALVERFSGAVYAAALTRMRNAHMAQELTQEVFVHAWRKIGQLRDPRCFAGWLRRITARMAINMLTRRVLPVGAGTDALENVATVTSDPLDKTISYTVVFLILGALPITVRTMYSRGEATVVE